MANKKVTLESLYDEFKQFRDSVTLELTSIKQGVDELKVLAVTTQKSGKRAVNKKTKENNTNAPKGKKFAANAMYHFKDVWVNDNEKAVNIMKEEYGDKEYGELIDTLEDFRKNSDKIKGKEGEAKLKVEATFLWGKFKAKPTVKDKFKQDLESVKEEYAKAQQVQAKPESNTPPVNKEKPEN